MAMRLVVFLILVFAALGVILGGQWVIERTSDPPVVALIQCADGSTQPVSQGCPTTRTLPQAEQSAPVQRQPQDDQLVRREPQAGTGNGATVGGGERRDVAGYGDPIRFVAGEAVYGETIHFDPPYDHLNCTGGHCYVERAPGSGQVYGGVVYPWHSEIRNKDLQVIPSS